MRVVCHEQHTAEWTNARLGKVTASNMWRALDVLKVRSKNGSKGDPSGEQIKYKRELMREILSGVPVEHWVSKEMEDGTKYEPLARVEYIFRNDPEKWERTGFVLHPTLDRLGASPDLLLGTSSLGGRNGSEFKCPKDNTHLAYIEAYLEGVGDGLTDNSLAYSVLSKCYEPTAYIYQVQTNILVHKSDWWDWVSYYPPEPEDSNQLPDTLKPKRANLPENMRYLQLRVYRDEAMIAEIEEGVKKFNASLLEYVEQMRAMKPIRRLNTQLAASIERENDGR